MELAGKIIAVLEARGGISKSTGNPWKTQDYVIETQEQYPHRMVFNVFGEDRINQFNIKVGDMLNVFFDVNAREYQGRWFNDIRAYRVDHIDPNAAPAGAPVPPVDPFAQTAPAPAAAPAAPAAPAFEQQDPAEDLPF